MSDIQVVADGKKKPDGQKMGRPGARLGEEIFQGRKRSLAAGGGVLRKKKGRGNGRGIVEGD